MIPDATYEQLQAQYEARIERHNDEIEEHKETFRLLKAAEAERDAARQACEKAIRERRSLEQKEDDWHTAYEHALAEIEAARARADWLWKDCDEKHRQIKTAEAERDAALADLDIQKSVAHGYRVGVKVTMDERDAALARVAELTGAIEEYAWMGTDDEVERGDLQRAFRSLARAALGDPS